MCRNAVLLTKCPYFHDPSCDAMYLSPQRLTLGYMLSWPSNPFVPFP